MNDLIHPNRTNQIDQPNYPRIGACPRGRPVLLRHRHDPTNHIITIVTCNAWNCSACRIRMTRCWHNRIAQHLAVDCQAGRFAFTEITPDVQWTATRQRLLRMKANFARIKQPGDKLLLIGTSLARLPIDVSHMEATGVLEVAMQELVTREVAAIKGKSQRPISTSRRWGAVDQERDFKQVSRIRQRGEEAIRTALKEAGIAHRTRRRESSLIVQLRIDPQTMSPNSCREEIDLRRIATSLPASVNENARA